MIPTSSMINRLLKIGLVLAYHSLVIGNQCARADGGTLRLSRCEGPYRISVFTGPTPLRAGPVDISVLVQDTATADVDLRATVMVRIMPANRTGRPMYEAATSNTATNKLLRAAMFELPAPGRWSVEIEVQGEQGSAQVNFVLEAATRLPQWPVMASWIAWPIPVIALFSLHQVLIWRGRRRLA